jgi:flagellar basal-body rod protein FlgB
LADLEHLARLLLIFAKQTRFVQRFRETQTAFAGNLKKMSKTNNIIDLLEAGIRAEGIRQKAIANNIANLQTSGYRRFDVKFEELLAKALKSSGSVELSEIEPQIYQPKQTPVKSNGNDVNLEAEVGEMVKNTLRYKAYIRLLNRKYRKIELAINTK